MPRLDQAVGGQSWRLATFDDRADNVWREEGKIHEMSDAALGDGLTIGDCLHGRSGLDLLKPSPAQRHASRPRTEAVMLVGLRYSRHECAYETFRGVWK
jgi:hypothetical protein